MTLGSVLHLVIPVAITVGAVLAGWLVANLILRLLRRRGPKMWRAWKRLRRPLGATVLATALESVVLATWPPGGPKPVMKHVLVILVIASVVWLLATAVIYALTLSERRLIGRMATDRDRRRAHTQLRLIRRLITVAFAVVAIGMILLTFPGVERIGTGVVASAGLLSVVAGMAAQSSLANLFAGIQLAFSDAIRIDDIVEVEEEWGQIEDITLTYVVVRIWDERRMILPSTYFTTTPFTNWTRTGSQIVGTVLFQLDWRSDIAALRALLDELLAETNLWDGRTSSLKVTDTTDGLVTVRVVVSTKNADNLFDLQCLIRESFTTWMREHHPEALPTQRVRYEPAASTRSGETARQASAAGKAE